MQKLTGIVFKLDFENSSSVNNFSPLKESFVIFIKLLRLFIFRTVKFDSGANSMEDKTVIGLLPISIDDRPAIS